MVDIRKYIEQTEFIDIILSVYIIKRSISRHVKVFGIIVSLLNALSIIRN